MYFCHRSQVLHLPPTGCKICFHDFLNQHRMAEIYVKLDLRKSSSTQVGELLYSTAKYGTYCHGNYICVLLTVLG